MSSRPVEREADGSRTVEEHLAASSSSVEPLPPYDQPVARGARAAALRGRRLADRPARLRQLGDGRVRRARRRRRRGAAEHARSRLPVVGEIAAGQSAPYALAAGHGGADHDRRTDAARAPTRRPGRVDRRRHRRRSASSAARAGRSTSGARARTSQAGDLLLAAGTVLGPRQVGLLAAVGRGRVLVRPRPRVVVLSTGDELREPGRARLGFDSIYDSNSYMLAAAAREAGAIAYRVGIVGDDPHTFSDALEDQLVRADLVVTTGGVSKGAYDVVKEVLSRLGTVEFVEVAMQPGKPQGFGTIGEDQTPIFTLPGNPVSAYVSFEVFVRPALRRMMGRVPYRRARWCRRRLTEERARRCRASGSSCAARFECGAEGWTSTPVGGHGSHLLGRLAHAERARRAARGRDRGRRRRDGAGAGARLRL